MSRTAAARRIQPAQVSAQTKGKRVLVAIGWLMVLAACAKTTTRPTADDAGQDAPLTGQPSEETFIEELCRKAQPCCAAASIASDAAACHAKLEARRAQSDFDGHRALACLKQLRAVSFDDTGCPSNWIAPFCAGVFYERGGAKVAGDSCGYTNDDCGAPPGQRAFCGPNDEAEIAAKTAHCHALAHASEGERCDATLEATGTIQSTFAYSVHPTTGAYCDTADSLRCDPSSSVCVSDAPTTGRVAIGKPCSPIAYELQAWSACGPDAYCSISTFKCEPKEELDGECSVKIGCSSGNCANGRCAPSFGGLALDLVCAAAVASSAKSTQ